MKKVRDLALTLVAFAALLALYDHAHKSDEESAARDVAAWQGKIDK